MGQIDLLKMIKGKKGWEIELAEVKSSDTGVEAMEKFQKKRLYLAQNFLGALFGLPVKLTRLIG